MWSKDFEQRLLNLLSEQFGPFVDEIKSFVDARNETKNLVEFDSKVRYGSSEVGLGVPEE